MLSGRKPAVAEATFQVERGEVFVIMGLSGSGKSTLLRMLNGLVTPTSGTVQINGRSLADMAPDRLRALRNKTVNMVFQSFAIFPHRTVLENAAFGLKLRGEAQESRIARARQSLATVGLSDWAHAFPSALSGGMQQRVGLARALATDAEVLLMDEPFSALDPIIRRDMQELLIGLQKELQKTIVFVTHDLNEAMRIGDRVMLMREGEVIQIGSGPEIMQRPASSYVAEFVREVDRSRVITAAEIAEHPTVLAELHQDPSATINALERDGVTAAYVLDPAKRIVGVTSTDLLRSAIKTGEQTLRGALHQDYAIQHGDETLSLTTALVGRHAVPLAVVDESENFIGVISWSRLLSALTPSLEEHNAHS